MLRESTETFIKDADWLRDVSNAPLLTALLMLATEIDAQPNASLFAEYGRTYRYALSLRPNVPDEIDPLDLVLRDAPSA